MKRCFFVMDPLNRQNISLYCTRTKQFHTKLRRVVVKALHYREVHSVRFKVGIGCSSIGYIVRNLCPMVFYAQEFGLKGDLFPLV